MPRTKTTHLPKVKRRACIHRDVFNLRIHSARDACSSKGSRASSYDMSTGDLAAKRLRPKGYDEKRERTWQVSIGHNAPPWKASPASVAARGYFAGRACRWRQCSRTFKT